ncbi:MAG: Yip1 family protein [Caulobacteraceae bacterium]
MSIAERPQMVGLIGRVQNILLRPKEEWDVIAAEPASVQSLFLGYAVIVAVGPFIGRLVGRVLLGGLLGGPFGMAAALVGGVVLGVAAYALNLGLVYVVSLIVNALAPGFDAKPDPVAALKVSVYSATALWVAGLVSWVPVIGWLIGLAALAYTCYLLYLGVEKVMKPPADKAAIYTAAIIIAEIVLYFVIAWIVAMVGAAAMIGAFATGAAMGPHL